MSNLCPKCLKDDQVQKVSAIIAGGTFTTTYQVPAQGEIAGHKIYGSMQQTGTGITELAQRLSINFPRNTQESYDFLRTYKTGYIEKISKAIEEKYPRPKFSSIPRIMVICAFLIWPIIGAILAISFNIDFEHNYLLGGLIGFPSIVCLVVAYIFGKEGGEWWTRANQFLKEAVENYFEGMKRKYSNMYYCHRDDVVFVPGETNWASSSEIMSFVFR